MTLCGDNTVDTDAVIEECSLEADRIAQTCDSEVSQAYLSGLQQAYDCLLDLEYCGTEEDVLAQPDAMSVCGALFDVENSAYVACTNDTGVDQSPVDAQREPEVIDYIPASTLRNQVVLEDDDSKVLELPFEVTFFGEAQTHLTITSNGLILMGEQDRDGCCYGQSLPQFDEYNGLIALGWGDLIPTGDRMVRWQVMGEAPNRELWIQYDNVPAITSATEHVSSRMRWTEGMNEVEIFIDSIWYTEAMTVGIESGDANWAVVSPAFNAQPIQTERVAHRYSVEVPQ
jgi:hypothetical protein